VVDQAFQLPENEEVQLQLGTPQREMTCWVDRPQASPGQCLGEAGEVEALDLPGPLQEAPVHKRTSPNEQCDRIALPLETHRKRDRLSLTTMQYLDGMRIVAAEVIDPQ